MPAQPTIAAALSGGVDSATAAAVLLEEGYRVIGVTMRLCKPGGIEDARRVCRHLGIPFHVVDFSAEFERRVVGGFVDAYLAGETPNPCTKCNQHIKFGALLGSARDLGAEAVATGHYARLEARSDGTYRLRRGADPAKDQSYFLFAMPREEMRAIRFPLGGLTKEAVRNRARQQGLHNANRGESQEICFVPDGEYGDFVERRAREQGRPVPAPGPIVDMDGAIVGEHRGVHRYTIGQRRGLGVGGRRSAEGDPGCSAPVYVVDVDPEQDRVVVGPKSAAARRELRVRDVSWLADPPAPDQPCLVQVRHRAQAAWARVVADGTGAMVTFEGREVVAAPGQAAVFYDRDVVMGGGWICSFDTGGRT